MTVWQYAQLRVTHEDRLAAGDSWTIAWYGPDATKRDTAHGMVKTFAGSMCQMPGLKATHRDY